MTEKREFLMRYIKFNIVGTFAFLIATLAYFLMPSFGFWRWFISNAIGGAVQFLAVYRCNKTGKGRIFEV